MRNRNNIYTGAKYLLRDYLLITKLKKKEHLRQVTKAITTAWGQSSGIMYLLIYATTKNAMPP
jgi:hypothetical protein